MSRRAAAKSNANESIDVDSVDDDDLVEEVEQAALDEWKKVGDMIMNDPDEFANDDEFDHKHKKDEALALKMKTYPGDVDIEYTDGFEDIFNKVPPGEGDETMSVKPWLGAIKEPVPCPKGVKKAPQEDFAIDWVYGYRSEESRMNLHYNLKGQLVYSAACLGIIYDYEKMTQIYFGGGKTKKGGRKQNDDSKDSHTDDVTALALSDSKKVVATG